MTEPTSYKMLDNNDPIVQQVLKSSGITPPKNTDTPKPVGSSKTVIAPVIKEDPIEAEIKAAEKPKKVSVSLNTFQYATLTREAMVAGIDIKERLQQIVNEALEKRLGKATITQAKFMGSQKVTSVTGMAKRQ